MTESCRETLINRALVHGLEFDPKNTSNTTLRSEIARVEIPELVVSLIQKLQDGHELTDYDKNSLYKTYQRYFQSKEPFKRPLPSSHGEIWNLQLNRERNIRNLLELVDPSAHNKQIVYLLLQGLWPVQREELRM